MTSHTLFGVQITISTAGLRVGESTLWLVLIAWAIAAAGLLLAISVRSLLRRRAVRSRLADVPAAPAPDLAGARR